MPAHAGIRPDTEHEYYKTGARQKYAGMTEWK